MKTSLAKQSLQEWIDQEGINAIPITFQNLNTKGFPYDSVGILIPQSDVAGIEKILAGASIILVDVGTKPAYDVVAGLIKQSDRKINVFLSAFYCHEVFFEIYRIPLTRK
jgi:hypothetical protein